MNNIYLQDAAKTLMEEACMAIREARLNHDNRPVREFIQKPFSNIEFEVAAKYQQVFNEYLCVDMEDVASLVAGKVLYLKNMVEVNQICVNSFLEILCEIVVSEYNYDASTRSLLLIVFRIDWNNDDAVYNRHLKAKYIQMFAKRGQVDKYFVKANFEGLDNIDSKDCYADSDDFADESNGDSADESNGDSADESNGDFADDSNDDEEVIIRTTRIYVLGIKAAPSQCKKFLEYYSSCLNLKLYSHVINGGFAEFDFLTAIEAYHTLDMIRGYFIAYIEPPCISTGDSRKIFQYEF